MYFLVGFVIHTSFMNVVDVCQVPSFLVILSYVMGHMFDDVAATSLVTWQSSASLATKTLSNSSLDFFFFGSLLLSLYMINFLFNLS
jgi:hypothetical protein